MRGGFAWVVILGFATAARAQIFDFSLTAEVNLEADQDVGASQSYYHKSFANQFPDAAVPQFSQGSVSLGTNFASGRALATFGQLSAGGSASSTVDPTINHEQSAHGGGGSEVQDTVNVQSSTLADGTPVSLSVVYALSGSYNPPNDNSGNSSGGLSASLDAYTSQSGNSLNVEYDNQTSQNLSSLGGTLDAQVGEKIHLKYSLSSYPLSVSAGVLNAASSAIGGSLSIQSETPGVTLIADSSYDYTQSVPEPSAMASVGAALVGLVTLARRGARGPDRLVVAGPAARNRSSPGRSEHIARSRPVVTKRRRGDQSGTLRPARRTADARVEPARQTLRGFRWFWTSGNVDAPARLSVEKSVVKSVHEDKSARQWRNW